MKKVLIIFLLASANCFGEIYRCEPSDVTSTLECKAPCGNTICNVECSAEDLKIIDHAGLSDRKLQIGPELKIEGQADDYGYGMFRLLHRRLPNEQFKTPFTIEPKYNGGYMIGDGVCSPGNLEYKDRSTAYPDGYHWSITASKRTRLSALEYLTVLRDSDENGVSIHRFYYNRFTSIGVGWSSDHKNVDVFYSVESSNSKIKFKVTAKANCLLSGTM